MVQIPYHFFRERLISGLSVAKPALDLLSDRLERASRKDHFATITSDTDSTSNKLKAPSRTSISELIDRHGRFETAVLCATVENMACLCFLRQYGARGAVERTLPVLGERALDTFDYAYSHLLDKGYVFVDSTVRSLDPDNSASTPNNAIGKAVSAIQGVVLFFLTSLDATLRFIISEDYLTLATVYLRVHLVHTSACVTVNLSNYSVKIAQFQSSSSVVNFIFDRSILLTYMVIISWSIVFAFLSVYTIRPMKDTDTRESDSIYCDAPEATEPPSTVLRTSDWRTSGVQVVGFRDSPDVYSIEEESFRDFKIQVQVEGPSSESEDDEERAFENLSFTPYGRRRITAELKGKMKETYDHEGLMNSSTPFAGNVAFFGSVDTPEVEDVFYGLREYYEERKRHYGSSVGSLPSTTSSSGNEGLPMSASLTFEHISKLNGPILLTSASSTLFSETGSDGMHVGSELDVAPLGPTEAKALDAELKEALDILTSPIIREEMNAVITKWVSNHAYFRCTATSKVIVKSNLAPHAPPYISMCPTAPGLNLAEENIHPATPAFWAPAPVVPVKIEPPPPRQSRSKSRRSKHFRRAIVQFRALDP